MTRKGKIITWTAAIIAVALAIFIYFKFCFVFGEGVKAGELNQIMYKGWVWKTYEGFSVVDKAVADSLMKCSGKMVELHYKQYNGRLPWRGMQKHIVDGIISVRESDINSQVPYVAPVN